MIHNYNECSSRSPLDRATELPTVWSDWNRFHDNWNQSCGNSDHIPVDKTSLESTKCMMAMIHDSSRHSKITVISSPLCFSPNDQLLRRSQGDCREVRFDARDLCIPVIINFSESKYFDRSMNKTCHEVWYKRPESQWISGSLLCVCTCVWWNYESGWEKR